MLSFTILTLFQLEHLSLKPNNDPSSSCSFFLDTSLTNKWPIFSENSHFGMIATGTFTYFIFSIKKKKYYIRFACFLSLFNIFKFHLCFNNILCRIYFIIFGDNNIFI